jgi:hypothetical protein
VRSFRALILLFVAAIVSPPSRASDPFVATLRLDPFSIVSFGDEEVYQLPEGSEIKFEFPAAEGSGSLGFVIHPRDALIGRLPLQRQGESLLFTLARTATGVMRVGSDGRLIVEINAHVNATLDHPEMPGLTKLPIHFTTESAKARSLAGDRVIDVAGGRVSGRAVQLVGTATNTAADYPKPGAAVYVILSGVFDRLPALQ